jgi:hypothetical protein
VYPPELLYTMRTLADPVGDADPEDE